jgi:ubiquinone/menaquinone biosynthesis C-methylase UbiE
MKETVSYRAKVEYDDQKSARYDHRPVWRNEPEMALLEPALRLFVPGSKVLDAPCGAGRVSVRLCELGMRVTALDIAPAMIERTREKLRGFGAENRVTSGDLEHLDFPDGAFEGAVCFRFFHHLPTPQLRQQVISELCRVSRRYVVMSFYHPVSLHNLKRYVQSRWLGRPQRRFPIAPRDLAALFARHSFRQVLVSAQRKYLSTLWLAAFQRS